MAPRASKNTQRDRLLTALVEVANKRGYGGANVSAVIAEAGISRKTFYDYFADRDSCFTTALEEVQAEVLGLIESALQEAGPAEAINVAVETIVGFAEDRPARARFLMGESMSGGRPALDARDRGLAAIAVAIDAAREQADAGEKLADLDSRILLGGVYRMLATRLRRGESKPSQLGGELRTWIAAYEVPARARKWRVLKPAAELKRSPHVPEVPIQQMPSVYPPGRPRAPEAEIAENHRLRILYAAARLAQERGYLATTVEGITKFARVDGRVFYRLFVDKQEAFTAAQELGFQQVMDVTSKAFFAAEGWPERSWEAGRALTGLLQANPMVANVGFVEAYAVGPGAAQRIEDSHSAFMFFLQEGLLQRPGTPPPSQVAMEAIVASIFEVIYVQARRGEKQQIAGMLPYIAHLWLTPFLGVEQTGAFIDSKLSATKKRRSPAKPSKGAKATVSSGARSKPRKAG